MRGAQHENRKTSEVKKRVALHIWPADDVLKSNSRFSISRALRHFVYLTETKTSSS
jgi:hypothetical protein